MIRRQFEILRRWAVFLLATAAIGGMAAYWYAQAQLPTYAADARLAVQPGANPDLNAILVSQQLAAQYATLAGTRDFAEAVQARLGASVSADEVAQAVTARSDAASNIVSVTARADSPEKAAALANAAAATLEDSVQGSDNGSASAAQQLLDSLDQEIQVIQADIDGLQGIGHRSADQELQLQQLIDRRLALQSNYTTLLPYTTQGRVGRLEMLEQALPPTTPSGFRPPVYAILGVLAAFILAAAIAFVVEYFDDTIRDLRYARVLGVPVLGGIRHRRRERIGDPATLAVVAAPRSNIASDYRNLRALLDLESRESATRSVLVTSIPSAVGKGLVAANLALAYAETGRRVILMDADMDVPELHRIFGLVNTRGFAQLVANPRGMTDALAGADQRPNLRVVTAGSPLDGQPFPMTEGRVREIVDAARRECDVVVIDGPTLGGALHPIFPLATVADRTILVATWGKSRWHQLNAAARDLALVRSDSAGVVLYGVPAGYEVRPGSGLLSGSGSGSPWVRSGPDTDGLQWPETAVDGPWIR